MALKWLRDNLRHLKFILWGVVIVFVLLVFVDWGAGLVALGQGSPEVNAHREVRRPDRPGRRR